MKTVKHLIEKINIWNPKTQGSFFEISTPESFAKKRCDELNSTKTAKEYKHDYQFIINPKEKNGMPSEIYQTTAISISQGVKPVTIAIYRKFKK
jgi:hypothetical protein